MDIGRQPTLRFVSNAEVALSSIVTDDDLTQAMSLVGRFDDDNRAGIDGTLHRISAIKARSGKVVGITCRVGRVIEGSASMVEDLIRGGRNILLLGRPGVGKTTAIRDISYLLSTELKKRCVIIDTSNEIGGDGDIPHSGIGDARRLQVPKPEQQHKTMQEAVENHFPQTIIIDEIGTEQECQAARTISQRGVQLVGTAHGQTLDNLIKNPSLNLLVGGIQNVTLGDEAAKRRNVQKTIQERAGPPTFDVCIEMTERNRWRIHTDVAASVDSILAGGEAKVLTRERDLSTGNVRTVSFMGIVRRKLSESDEQMVAMEFWRTSDGEDILQPIEKGSSSGSGGIPHSLASLNGGSNSSKKAEQITFVAPPPPPPSSQAPSLSPSSSTAYPSTPDREVAFRPPPSLLPLPPPRPTRDPSPSATEPPTPSPPLLSSYKPYDDVDPAPPPPLDLPQRKPRASIPNIERLEGADPPPDASRRLLSTDDLQRGVVAWSEEEAWREGKEKIEGSREEREPLNPIVPPGRSNEGPWPKPSPPSNVPAASALTLEALRQMTGKASPTLPPQYSSAPSTSSSSPTNAKRVFLYMDDESAVKVERVLSSLPDFAANATFTRDFDSAQIIIATQKKIRSNPKMKSLLTRLQIPIVGLKSSSTASIIRDLCSPLGLDPLLSSEVIVSPEASMDEEGQPQSYDARGSRPLGGQGRAAVSSSDDFADLLEQTVRELKGSPVDREFAQNCLRSFLEELPSGGCQASSLASMAWALSHCKHKKKLLESSREDLIALMNQCEGRWGELTPAHLLRIACGLSNLRLCPPSRKWFEEIEIRVKAGISAGSYKVEEEERVSAAIYTLDALLNIEEAQLESTEGITSMS